MQDTNMEIIKQDIKGIKQKLRIEENNSLWKNSYRNSSFKTR